MSRRGGTQAKASRAGHGPGIETEVQEEQNLSPGRTQNGVSRLQRRRGGTGGQPRAGSLALKLPAPSPVETRKSEAKPLCRPASPSAALGMWLLPVPSPPVPHSSPAGGKLLPLRTPHGVALSSPEHGKVSPGLPVSLPLTRSSLLCLGGSCAPCSSLLHPKMQAARGGQHPPRPWQTRPWAERGQQFCAWTR